MSVGNSKGSYLRVLSPVTSDGVSLVTESDRIKYREDHLPLSAKTMLEKKNERLPTSLRKKIEVVNDDVKPFIKPSQRVAHIQVEDSDLPEDFEDDEQPEDTDLAAAVEPTPTAKKKPGRKAKGTSND